MQHHSQEDDTKDLASNVDCRLGNCGDPAGRGDESCGILRRQILSGHVRERPVSRCRLLFLHVVQATRETVPCSSLLQRCRTRRCFWWYLSLRESH